LSPLSQRTALVTGASSGLGAAIARALGALGWSVAIGARRIGPLKEVAAQVEAAGGTAFAHELDVSELDSIEAFVNASEQRLGAIDTVVSNAGTSTPGRLFELEVEDLRREIDTNLLGPMLLARMMLPSLIERRSGDLVFISSQNAVIPRPLQLGYTATKTGLEAMVRVLQMELEGSGVRATTIRPGPTRSNFGMDWDPATIKRVLTNWKYWGVQRHHRYLPAESIASAVVHTVTAPAGIHFDLIQVNPEGPVEDPVATSGRNSH
jgi:NADP-dependent 3-hydroxy acid dehydrogenase YdfG